jgi:hypothetical protein
MAEGHMKRRGRPKGPQNERTWAARGWAEKAAVIRYRFLTVVMAADTIMIVKTDAGGEGRDGRRRQSLNGNLRRSPWTCASNGRNSKQIYISETPATQITEGWTGGVAAADMTRLLDSISADPALVAAA